ncbi:MAG: T9SS type A sorting domain-containing protein [Bacteroidales bacterium]|nr:T9SS type A sorting domain-containing protein [Bacteroidales bacterium]
MKRPFFIVSLLGLFILNGFCQNFPPPTNGSLYITNPNIIYLSWDPPNRELSSYNIYKNGGILQNTTDTYYYDTVFFAYTVNYNITAVYTNPDGESDPDSCFMGAAIPEAQVFPYYQGFEGQLVILSTSALIGNDYWEKTTNNPFTGQQAVIFYSETIGNSSRIFSPPFWHYETNVVVNISFWYKTEDNQNNSDDLFFIYKPEANWEKIGPLLYSDDWIHYDTTLPFTYGMQFGFDAVSNNGGGVYLDEVSFDVSSVSVLENRREAPLFDIYPNPCNKEMYISLKIPSSAKYILSLYNSMGIIDRTVVDQYLLKGKHSTSIDVRDLQSGVYFLRLTGGGGTFIKKVIIN